MKTPIKNHRYPVVSAIFFAAVLGGLCALTGCKTTEPQPPQPKVYKAHYLDDGSTLVVNDPFFDGNAGEDSLLEKLQSTTEDLRVECEKNALLRQEVMAVTDARDDLKKELDATREEGMSLNEQIAAMKVEISDRERQMGHLLREKEDLLEKLINLRLEKTKIEKELLKIKIAALSGEG
jgi:hypothetical protein